MEDQNDKSNLQHDDINGIESNKINDSEIQQENINNSDNNNEISQQKEKNVNIAYINENVNKALISFANEEENSLSDLASSLIRAIAVQEKDKNENEIVNNDQKNEVADNDQKNEIADEERSNNNDKDINNETSEEDKTETEVESDNEPKNEVTLVNVLTETDPIFQEHETDHNSYKEPTFQTGLDNPNITRRPGSSQILKRRSSVSSNNRTRIVIRSNNNSKRYPQRPSTASSIRSNSIPNEEKLQNALDLMILKRILPDLEIRPEVINYARKLISRKMLEESYDEASEIDIAIDIMFTSIEQDQIKEEEILKKNALQFRMDQAMDKQKETRDKYTEMIQDEENRYKEKYDEMIRRHSLEIENFKEEWRNPDRIKMFNKPSSKLFQMRKQQKSMALVHDFQNAKQMKMMADQLEKQEADFALQRAKESMQIEYQQIIERQQREIFCLKENHEKNINTIKLSQGKDEELVQNTLQSIKLKMETNKSAKKPKLMLPVRKQRCASTSQSVPTTGMITYRTRSQLNNYRKESDKLRLPIKLDFIDQEGKKMKIQTQ